jgi:hypothetical protein
MEQLEQFYNLPQNAKLFFNNFYNNFETNFNHAFPFSPATLTNLIKHMNSAIGFTDNHAQIFRLFAGTIGSVVEKPGCEVDVSQLYGLCK